MYWKLEEARRELFRRQNDPKLLKAVNDCLGKDCPIPTGNFGFIARQIATCRYEDLLFNQRCRSAGIEPRWLEYREDSFCTSNPSKMRLINLKLFNGVGRKGGVKLRTIKLIKKPSEWDGRPLSEVRIDEGETLVAFHHKLRRRLGWQNGVLDTSSWLKSRGGGKADEFYELFFLIFVTRGILFESFESPGFPDLEKFKRRIVIPAWEETLRNFPAPLIVLHPGGSASRENKMLRWYPEKILNFRN